MTSDDLFLLKLTAWRENRSSSFAMQSVINAIMNRAAKHSETVYDVCTDRLQFSSVTALGDSQTVAWAKRKTPADWQAWQTAEQLVESAESGTLEDLTHGATMYYAPRGLRGAEIDPVPFDLPDGTAVSFPKSWNRAAVKFETEIAGQLFFMEV